MRLTFSLFLDLLTGKTPLNVDQDRPREAPTYVYPAKILFRALKSAIILAWKVLSVIRIVTWSQNVTFRYIIWKKFPPARGTWYSVANTISWAAYHLYLISSLFCGFWGEFELGIFTGLRCEQAQQDRNVQRKIYAKSEKRQALRLPICNDFSRLVCRYEALRHKAVALQLPCWCYQNFLPWAHKSAIYGEGSGPKHQLEGPKSAILEKELAIFELRKV